MIAAVLRRAGAVLDWLSASLLLVMALRLAFVAWNEMKSHHDVRLTPLSSLEEPKHTTGWPNLQALQKLVADPNLDAGELDSGLDASQAIRVSLVITEGARSEIRIDGNYVGKSPYIGDWSCRRGERIRIDLLPARGVPRRFTTTCQDGTVRVGE
jgi:hypothetical protein